jgi:hypothetical protein
MLWPHCSLEAGITKPSRLHGNQIPSDIDMTPSRLPEFPVRNRQGDFKAFDGQLKDMPAIPGPDVGK